MHPIRTAARLAAVVAAIAGIAACADQALDPIDTPDATVAAMSKNPNGAPAPGGLMDVTFAGATFSVWPWTGRDLSGTPVDPINLVFTGQVDVVSLRAALRALDGDRSPRFPNAPPFNCTWTDAHGEMQTAWSEDGGWTGNPVQMQCGDYDPIRFHIRLFPAGDRVLAGTHFDLRIPFTPEHRVISWELAEQLVAYDFIRSGLLDAGAPFAQVPLGTPGNVGNPIERDLYNGMPAGLVLAIGGPAQPVSGNVGVPSDGMATVLNVATRTAVRPDYTESTLSMPFDQLVPRPFCSSGPYDYVLLQGPVDLTTSTRVNANGNLQTHNTLRGELEVTPIDVFTMLPSGPTFRAQISEIDNYGVTAAGGEVNAILERKALPPGVGFLKTHLVTGPNGLAHYTYSEKCK